MLKHLLAIAFALAVGSAALASVVVSLDILDPSDGGTQPPPGVVCVDVYADVTDGTPPLSDTWTAGGVRINAYGGATFRYATDPNGIILNNVGIENRFTTFFSRPRPRDDDSRYTNAAAEAAGGWPSGLFPRTFPTEVSVAYFASPPVSSMSPPVDGYVFRASIDLPGDLPPGALIVWRPGATPAPDILRVLMISEGPPVTADLGTVCAAFDVPSATGLDWHVGVLIPEPASLVLLIVALAAAGRR